MMKDTVNVVAILAVLAMAPVALSARSAAAPQGAGESIKKGATKTKDGVVNGARVVANKTKDGVSKTGEIMTDGWITSRVSARFVNEDSLKNSDINVDTNDHIVTLKGTVLTSAGRSRAAVVAKQTEGVRGVVNKLTLVSKSQGEHHE
jgi:hyperosmotically inducible periplasmic protein